MNSNFSFCIALLLLVQLSTAIFTGTHNSEEFPTNKVASSSFDSVDENAEKPAIHNIVRNKRGFDYSDYSSESSEENNFGYHHKRQYPTFPVHWPHHHLHHSPPAQHTGGYGSSQGGPSRAPYYPGKYHLYFHDKKCKFPFYSSEEYGDSNSNEHTENPIIPPITNNPVTPSTTSTETIPVTSSTTTPTTTEEAPDIDIRFRN